MTMIGLAVVATGLTACTGPTVPVSATPTPITGEAEALEVPNGFPSMTRPGTTINPVTDVVGVTQLPP